jgi:hypothetical protein
MMARHDAPTAATAICHVVVVAVNPQLLPPRRQQQQQQPLPFLPFAASGTLL